MIYYQDLNYLVDGPHVSWDISVLRILQTDWPRKFSPMPNYKFSNHLLPYFNLYKYAKNHAKWPNGSWVATDMQMLLSNWLRIFLTYIFCISWIYIWIPKIKLIHQLLFQIYLRTLKSDWPRAFWFIHPESKFSQICDLCGHNANNMNIYLTPDPEKSNDKIFRKTL